MALRVRTASRRARIEAFVQQAPQLKPNLRSESANGRERKHERALALYADGKFEPAAVLLRQALLEAPSSELANDIGAVELACGRPEQALAQFFLATSLDPENTEAVANIGTLLAHMNRLREAIPHLQKAAYRASDPRHRKALGALLAQCGQKVADRVLIVAFVEVCATSIAVAERAVWIEPDRICKGSDRFVVFLSVKKGNSVVERSLCIDCGCRTGNPFAWRVGEGC